MTNKPINTHCPWSGDPVTDAATTLYRGVLVGFCNTGCREKFDRATAMFDAAIDNRAKKLPVE